MEYIVISATSASQRTFIQLCGLMIHGITSGRPDREDQNAQEAERELPVPRGVGITQDEVLALLI